jgi:LPS-assembly protein
MGQRRRPFLATALAACAGLAACLLVFFLTWNGEVCAQANATAQPGAGQPLNITADRIDYLQELEIYEAEGSVVVTQGALRLTADHVTIRSLSGLLIAVGHARLGDPSTEASAERLELNVNTEAGVLTNGSLFVKSSNSYVTGRLLQRFSEDHYRIKDGTFTNCDAKDGEIPAWRFQFDDLDVDTGESVAMKGAWLCVNDRRVIPIPTLTYPLTTRRSGFLVPSPGYDNRFGLRYQQSYFWAINPSQDLTISPLYYSNLGYGSDFDYRYFIDRRSRGRWFVSFLQQTELPDVSGVDQNEDARRARGLISGSHIQQVTPTLLIQGQASLVTDREYLQQLSNSGAQRAAPSGESNLLGTQKLPYGNAYMLAQYLQPLNFGGPDTFQRLPEIGYIMPNTAPTTLPLLMNFDSSFVNFYRDQGFTLNRMDLVPGLTTDIMDIGHVIGIAPHFKFREVYYTRGAQTTDTVRRETFWAALEATSKLSRRFGQSQGGTFLHTIEPSLMYEYVPASDQSQIAQIDQVDDLPKKNLLTYAFRSRLLEQKEDGKSFNWLDLTLAQSYHVGGVQTQARDFTPGVEPFLGTVTQPLQPATVPIQGKRFSDFWLRAVVGNTAPEFFRPPSLTTTDFSQSPLTGQLLPPRNQYLIVDAFFDPYRGTFSQWNTDFRVQQSNYWYVEVGQRYARDGNRVRRGDVWNPISFNEVFAPTAEVTFVTAGGGFRTPWGWTVGAKAYYDIKNGRSPEYDVVGLYQNPCKCWSLGLYYLQFPDRAQYNFMFSLTGIGWTENFGTNVLRKVLGPLLIGERGLPWAAPGGPYGRAESVLPLPSMPSFR